MTGMRDKNNSSKNNESGQYETVCRGLPDRRLYFILPNAVCIALEFELEELICNLDLGNWCRLGQNENQGRGSSELAPLVHYVEKRTFPATSPE